MLYVVCCLMLLLLKMMPYLVFPWVQLTEWTVCRFLPGTSTAWFDAQQQWERDGNSHLVTQGKQVPIHQCASNFQLASAEYRRARAGRAQDTAMQGRNSK